MKKFLALLQTLVIVTLLISCGVILDPLKIQKAWPLSSVTFYQYNELYDSYKKWPGINDLSPDAYSPIFGDLFGVRLKNISLTFEDNRTGKDRFYIKGYDASGDVAIDIISKDNPGYWEVDTFNNSIILTMPEATTDPTDSLSLWHNGKTLINDWPMSTNDDFDLYIKASDFGLDKFTADLSGDIKLDIYSIEAKFSTATAQ